MNDFKYVEFIEIRRVVIGFFNNKFFLEKFVLFIDCMDVLVF